jgi:hypothetical protein
VGKVPASNLSASCPSSLISHLQSTTTTDNPWTVHILIPDNKMVSPNSQTKPKFTARKLVLLLFSFLSLQQLVFLFSMVRQFAPQDAPMLPAVIEFQAQAEVSHPLKDQIQDVADSKNISDAKKALRVLQAEKI